MVDLPLAERPVSQIVRPGGFWSNVDRNSLEGASE